jgi:hypothetical protein
MHGPCSHAHAGVLYANARSSIFRHAAGPATPRGGHDSDGGSEVDSDGGSEVGSERGSERDSELDSERGSARGSCTSTPSKPGPENGLYADLRELAARAPVFAAQAQFTVPGPVGEAYKPGRKAVDPVGGQDGEHWQLIYRSQCADLQIAQRIGAMASLPLLDNVGNVHPSVWAPKLFPNSVGRLTDTSLLAKSMWTQMEQQITDNKAMISQMDDMQTVPDWQYNYIKVHEDRLQQHTRRVYDISPAIMASMHECMFRVQPHFQNLGMSMSELAQSLRTQKGSALRAPPTAAYQYLEDADLSMRFLFRHHITRDFMCTIAGRVMNKQEVCNRPGSWASTKTRHDLTRDIDEALIRMWDDENLGATWMGELRQAVEAKHIPPSELWTILDHTKHQ